MKFSSFFSKIRLLVLLALGLFVGVNTSAQSLTGTVTDAESGEPLPFASVYLSNTTYATNTDTTGAYSLTNMTPGRYTLAARMVGYIPYYQTVTLQAGIKTQINVKLKADGRELAEVKVTAQRDKVWEKQYQTFFNVFFGENASAKACKIINPWVIELEEKGGTLTAKADQIIEIENRYLGYKVLYDLRSFKFTGSETFYSGLTSFQPLIATNALETQQWKANREKAFFGSEIHFFKNLTERKTAEAGYEAYVDKPGADPHSRSRFFYQDQAKKLTQFALDTLVAGSQDTYQIRLPRRFELHSAGGEGTYAIYRDKPVQVSWIETTGKPLIFNGDGLLLNPQEWAVSGYLANLRMAETLPINYLASQRAPIIRRTGDDRAAFSWIERPVFTTDQPYYRPGQNVSIAGHMQYRNPAYRDSLSRLLRVELFNSDKKTVYSARWIVQEGSFQGQILLPDTLRPGMYQLRIHSEWMRNFSDDIAATQWVPLISRSEKPLRIQPTADSLLSLSVIRRDTALQWRLDTKNLNLATVSLSVLDERIAPLAYPETPVVASLASLDFPQKINFPIERGITLSGRVEGKKDKGVAEAQVLLVVPRLGLSFVSLTDSEGRFRFSDLPIQGTQQVLLKATNARNKPAGTIELDAQDRPLPAPTLPAPYFPLQPTLEPLKIVYDTDYAARAVQLNEVAVKAQRTPPPPKVYRQPDYTVQGRDIQNAVGSNFLVALQGRVPGLEIREARDADGFIKLVIFIRGGTSAGFSSSNKNTPLFLVDGVPFEDINQIASISPASVQRVEVVTRAEPMLGMRGYGGVISIFTKQGASTENALEANDPSAKKITLEGYTVPTNKATASVVWLPDLNLNLVGVTVGQIPLLPTGQYRFVVEGFTVQGQRVRGSSFIRIE